MSLKYTLIQNYLQNDGSFYGRLVIGSTYTREQIVARMLSKGTSLTSNEVKGVLDLLQETISEVIKDGHAINLDNFMRITPTLKGSFENSSEGFNSSKHTIALRTRMDREFINSMVRNLTVEKVDRSMKQPFIDILEDTRHNEPVLVMRGANRITGANLNKYKLISLEIINSIKKTEKLEIPVSELDTPTFSNKELVFIIMSDQTPPAWLKQNTGINIKLNYHDPKKDVDVASNGFSTVWKG